MYKPIPMPSSESEEIQQKLNEIRASASSMSNPPAPKWDTRVSAWQKTLQKIALAFVIFALVLLALTGTLLGRRSIEFTQPLLIVSEGIQESLLTLAVSGFSLSVIAWAALQIACAISAKHAAGIRKEQGKVRYATTIVYAVFLIMAGIWFVWALVTSL